MRTIRVLLLSGSLRDGSTNTAVLRTVATVAPHGVQTAMYEGVASLPHFNPDEDPDGGPVDPAVAALRAEMTAADALLICTPEYAAALPGSLKNVLEWTVGDASTYRKPVAWINASSIAAPTGGADAHSSLEKVLAYVGADIVEGAIVRLPIPRAAISSDGLIADRGVREQLRTSIATLAAHARERPRPDGHELERHQPA